jgi:hypothetical protein
MVGKIRLGKNVTLDDDNETLVYPSTSFMTKKISRKKRTSRSFNHNLIERLRLYDLSDDNTNTRIKNAFYN